MLRSKQYPYLYESVLLVNHSKSIIKNGNVQDVLKLVLRPMRGLQVYSLGTYSPNQTGRRGSLAAAEPGFVVCFYWSINWIIGILETNSVLDMHNEDVMGLESKVSQAHMLTQTFMLISLSLSVFNTRNTV